MTVSLDFIAAQLQRVLDSQTEIKQRIAAVEERLVALEEKGGQHNDEMTVLTGMVMRYAGEHIAWGGMQSELRRLRERVEALENQVR
jgi:uncharacterized coiled-coil protein SlyX